MQNPYDLTLSPVIPRFYTDPKTGRKFFNKGSVPTHVNGKTYEEAYGPERAADIKRRISEAMKGFKHKPDRRPAHTRSIVRILPDGSVLHYPSVAAGARAVGVSGNAIRQRIRLSSTLQGRWFYEADSTLWQRYHSTLMQRINQPQTPQ
jgi:hypothetical protein